LNPASQRPPKRIYLALWLVGIVPRLILALVFFDQPIALDDMFQYDMLARSILSGEGYRWYKRADFETLRPYYRRFIDVSDIEVPEQGLKTTFRAPGYPIFLAGLYALFPSQTRFGWTRIAQALLTASLAPLSALLALQNGFGRKSAWLAGLGAAFYPILLFYPLGLASENVFIPLITAGYAALLQTSQDKRWKGAVISGLLLGASMLTRSISLPFVLLAPLWAHFSGRLNKRKTLLILLVAFGLCTPWAIRNSRIMGKPAFVENSLGYNLFVGYHPEGDGSFDTDVALLPLTILDDAQRDRYTMQAAWDFIQADPGGAVGRVFRRAAFFLGVEDREMLYFYANNFFGPIQSPWRHILYLGLITPWLGILLFAPLGLMINPKREYSFLMVLLLAGYALPHLFVLAEPRFHLALVPTLLPFAAYGWVARGSALSSRRALLFIWICLAFFVSWNFSTRWELITKIMGPGGHQLHPPY
jgi:hypothetical protein